MGIQTKRIPGVTLNDSKLDYLLKGSLNMKGLIELFRSFQ